MTSPNRDRARALVQTWCDEVDWYGEKERCLLERLAEAALDAAEKRGACKRYSEPHTIPHDFIRADARRKMREEIEAALKARLFGPESTGMDDILAIIRKAAGGEDVMKPETYADHPEEFFDD